MNRWKNEPLMMSDIFDFSTATKEAGWKHGGFMGGSDIIFGTLGGRVDVMLQNSTLTGALQVDAVHNNMIKIFQKERYVVNRRIGYIDYGAYNISYLKNARKFIYATWP
ncbi:MAG: hypothetical protein KAT68_06375 [Bacteroidales bacterium]|nr:hypothetical protein [Bacteroidales bacterium]